MRPFNRSFMQKEMTLFLSPQMEQMYEDRVKLFSFYQMFYFDIEFKFLMCLKLECIRISFSIKLQWRKFQRILCMPFSMQKFAPQQIKTSELFCFEDIYQDFWFTYGRHIQFLWFPDTIVDGLQRVSFSFKILQIYIQILN